VADGSLGLVEAPAHLEWREGAGSVGRRGDAEDSLPVEAERLQAPGLDLLDVEAPGEVVDGLLVGGVAVVAQHPVAVEVALGGVDLGAAGLRAVEDLGGLQLLHLASWGSWAGILPFSISRAAGFPRLSLLLVQLLPQSPVQSQSLLSHLGLGLDRYLDFDGVPELPEARVGKLILAWPIKLVYPSLPGLLDVLVLEDIVLLKEEQPDAVEFDTEDYLSKFQLD
jgi:hypothetical protein